MVDQLDLLIGSVVSNAVVDHHVEAVPPTPHVDRQGDWVSHVNRAGDPGASQAVAGTDLHEALGRSEGEDHRVRGVCSKVEAGERAISFGHRIEVRKQCLKTIKTCFKGAYLFTVNFTFVISSERIEKRRGIGLKVNDWRERKRSPDEMSLVRREPGRASWITLGNRNVASSVTPPVSSD